MDLETTIVAVATAAPTGLPGRGGAVRTVIRLSGPQAHDVAERAASAAGRESAASAHVAVLRWQAPRSYTGQDVAEIHLPASPWLVRAVVEACLEAGATQAGPGEFTARAFLMGRMDLTQAEAVGLLVSAASERQMSAARRMLEGDGTSERVGLGLRAMADELAALLALVEAGIDFSTEDVTFISPEEIAARVGGIMERLGGMLAAARSFGSVLAVPVVALVGRPNAGKSTLMNWLLGRERVVADATPGTTRDAISATLPLKRGVVRLVDTAGLEGAESAGTLARAMEDATLATATSADVVALVVPVAEIVEPLRRRLGGLGDGALVLRTKNDQVASGGAGREVGDAAGDWAGSAVEGTGRERLLEVLDRRCFGELDGGGGSGGGAASDARVAMTQRQIRLVEGAVGWLRAAQGGAMGGAGDEMVALYLRRGLDTLGEVVGQVSPDDVIGRIFAGFCIGK